MSKKKHPSHHYHHLKAKWLKKRELLHHQLHEKHKSAFEWLATRSKQAAVGSLGSLIMLAQPVGTATVAAQQSLPSQQQQEVQKKVPLTEKQLIHDLSTELPEQYAPLTTEQETAVSKTLSEYFSLPVSAELQGKRLNLTYGIIGAEQHLMRYPGDTMSSHFATASESQKYYSSGMAPGRGAWGYFATSRATMTQEDIAREKYYIAVQTFLAPGYNSNVKEYSQFFKYRKMLIVNAENGKAMVVDIADAGPAQWTGKHLGGSPEVMKYLHRQDGAARGPVLYFFIDDPNDTIPLGPIHIK